MDEKIMDFLIEMIDTLEKLKKQNVISQKEFEEHIRLKLQYLSKIEVPLRY